MPPPRRHGQQGQATARPRPTGTVARIQGDAQRLKDTAAKVPVAPPTAASPRAIRAAVKPLVLEKGKSFRITGNKSVQRRFINMFLYGPYGHGKTYLTGTADEVPSMRDVLFINTDAGTMSLTSKRTMDFVNVTHYDQIARIFEYATLHCYYRDQRPMNVEKMLELEMELKSDPVDIEEQVTVDFNGVEVGTDPDRTWFVEQRLRSGKPMDEPYIYRTFVLDTISELHKLLVYKYTGVDISIHPLDEEMERTEEWYSLQELFRLAIRSFRDLPANFIVVSAEEIAGRGESDRKKGRRAGTAYPKLAGAVAADIIGFLDIAGYLLRDDPSEVAEGEKPKRYLYLAAGYEGWISKHRFENLPDLEYLENPTLAKLLDLSRKDAEHAASQTRGEAPERAVPPSRNRPGSDSSNRRSATAVTSRRR